MVQLIKTNKTKNALKIFLQFSLFEKSVEAEEKSKKSNGIRGGQIPR